MTGGGPITRVTFGAHPWWWPFRDGQSRCGHHGNAPDFGFLRRRNPLPGVAGASQPWLKIGDIVVGARLWQHDMDARPFFPRHEIPLLGRTSFAKDEKRRNQLLQAAAAFLRDDLPKATSEATRAAFHIQSSKAIE